MNPFDVFPDKVALRVWVQPDGCWLWPGAHSDKGYPQARIDGRTVNLHRWAYQKVNGPLPPDLLAHHECAVPGCCNPDHLRPVTYLEHRAEHPVVKSRKIHCPQGHPYDGRLRNGQQWCPTCSNLSARRGYWRRKGVVYDGAARQRGL